MEARLLIRLDEKTKKALNKIAEHEGRSVSDLMQQLAINYIKDRDIRTYIDDVWTRMGQKMKQRAITTKKIGKAISESRKSK